MGIFIFSKQALSSDRKSACIYKFTICRLASMFLLLLTQPNIYACAYVLLSVCILIMHLLIWQFCKGSAHG